MSSGLQHTFLADHFPCIPKNLIKTTLLIKNWIAPKSKSRRHICIPMCIENLFSIAASFQLLWKTDLYSLKKRTGLLGASLTRFCPSSMWFTGCGPVARQKNHYRSAWWRKTVQPHFIQERESVRMRKKNKA